MCNIAGAFKSLEECFFSGFRRTVFHPRKHMRNV